MQTAIQDSSNAANVVFTGPLNLFDGYTERRSHVDYPLEVPDTQGAYNAARRAHNETKRVTSEPAKSRKVRVNNAQHEKVDHGFREPTTVFSQEQTGRLSLDPAGEKAEFDSRLAKWNDQVYYDETILTGLEGGGSVAHN